MTREERRVVIEWHDQPNEFFETTVVIDENFPEYEDDVTVFFYFSSQSDFDQAKTGEGFEFRIVEELA